MKNYSVLKQNSNDYIVVDHFGNEIKDVSLYFRYLRACNRSPNTIRAYAYHLMLFLDYCSCRDILYEDIFSNPKIRPVDFFVDFMFWLQYPKYLDSSININGLVPIRSDITVNTIISVVMSFYYYLWANSREISDKFYRIKINTNNFKGFLSELVQHDKYFKQSIFRKSVTVKPIKFITRSQYSEIYKLCKSVRDKLLVALLFEGGLRLSEALGIHIDDIEDIQEGIVNIVSRQDNLNGARVKNNAQGLIKVPNYVVDLLLKYMMEYISDIDSEYLFVNLKGKNKGKPLCADTIEKLFLRLSKRIGYKVHPHMLRHGFATEKLEAGWEMVEIQAYLRHKNITSTQVYAQYSDMLKIEKMNKFIIRNEEILKKYYEDIK